jgi:hypothetical protein
MIDEKLAEELIQVHFNETGETATFAEVIQQTTKIIFFDKQFISEKQKQNMSASARAAFTTLANRITWNEDIPAVFKRKDLTVWLELVQYLEKHGLYEPTLANIFILTVMLNADGTQKKEITEEPHRKPSKAIYLSPCMSQAFGTKRSNGQNAD